MVWVVFFFGVEFYKVFINFGYQPLIKYIIDEYVLPFSGFVFALLVGMQIGAATVESSMEIPQKIKNGTALWPRNSTSGNLSEETQNTKVKEYPHRYLHGSIIYNRQDSEAAQVFISR